MKISAMAGSGAGCPAILAGAVNLACFLRNTILKSVLGTCGNGASSLRVRPHSIMSVVRRRGHPRVALSGLTDRTEWQVQVWQSKLGRSQGAKSLSGWRGARGSSIGACRTADTEPSHDKQRLEVQDEDGEKPTPRHRSESRCDRWGAGRRSSRKGQAGPVREDLQSVWCGVLLHPGHRHVSEDRRLGPRRIRLRYAWQLWRSVDRVRQ